MTQDTVYFTRDGYKSLQTQIAQLIGKYQVSCPEASEDLRRFSWELVAKHASDAATRFVAEAVQG